MSEVNQPHATIDKQIIVDRVDRLTFEHSRVIIYNNNEAAERTKALKIDCPSLPKTFVRRIEFFERLNSNIKRANTKFCIVRGESGSGKTTAVAEVYWQLLAKENYRGRWLDCRQITEAPDLSEFKNNADEKSLIVLDFLNDETHPLLRGSFFADLIRTSAIVVVTTSEAVERVTLQLVGLAAAASDICVQVTPFSNDEVSLLFSAASRETPSDSDIQKIADITRGIPIFCQMIGDIAVSEQCHYRNLLPSDRASYSETFLAQIFSYWLSCRVGNTLAESIVNCLLHLPFIGLDKNTLCNILSAKDASVSEQLARLVDNGILATVPKVQSTGRQIYYLHDLLRALRFHLPLPNETILAWREKYMRQLLGQLESGDMSGDDLLLCLDAWVSGWAFVFVSKDWSIDNRETFLARLAIHEQILPKITPSLSKCFEQADAISVVLKPYVNEKMNCAPLTGLAHMLRNIAPSYMVADMMWKATKNEDSWGRASALGVCISHWLRLGAGARLLGYNRLKGWMSYAIARGGAYDPDWWQEHSVGLDMIVALGGLARFRGFDEARFVFRDPRYQVAYGNCCGPNGMMMLRFWKEKLLDGSTWRKTEIVDIMEQFRKEPDETYLRVFDFLVEQPIDPSLKEQLREYIALCNRDHERVSLSGDIARYADCEEFRAFAFSKERNVKFHF